MRMLFDLTSYPLFDFLRYVFFPTREEAEATNAELDNYFNTEDTQEDRDNYDRHIEPAYCWAGAPQWMDSNGNWRDYTQPTELQKLRDNLSRMKNEPSSE